MRTLLSNKVIPKLKEKYHFPFILHRTLIVYGLGESTLAARIESWEDALPKHIKLAYLPNLGKMRLRLSAKGFDENQIRNEVQEQIDKVLPLIEKEFFGYEDEDGNEEAVVANQLTKIGKTLAIAESCTGGKLAQLFTSKPGASQYLKGGVVAYATQSKIDVLNVPEQLINEHSVVSAEVASAMAKNVLKLYKSDFAIATTGNAGPTKGDSNAEVGTVFIAIATADKVFCEEFNFGNHREKVINKGVNKALEMLQKEIFKN